MYVVGYAGFSHQGLSPMARAAAGIEAIFGARSSGSAAPQGGAGELPFVRFPLGYFGHDSSAALLEDGTMVAAAEEERFARAKFALNLAGRPILPREALQYCLERAGITLSQVDVVAHYCKFTRETIDRRIAALQPFLPEEEIERVASSYWTTFDGVLSTDAAEHQFREMAGSAPRRFLSVPHHHAHAASAYYPSGFNDALVLTLDAFGEVNSSTCWIGSGGRLIQIEATPLPYSLGMLYLVFTLYLGFKSLGDEYKVMGLASYGDPSSFRAPMRRMFERDASPATLLDPSLAERLERQFGPPRGRDETLSRRHLDIAAALQDVLTDTVLGRLRHLRAETGLRRLCMAGGVALNCSMNGQIARADLFEDIFVQPAAGDSGGSVGAAYVAHSELAGTSAPRPSAWSHTYWGPEYTDDQVLAELEQFADDVTWERSNDIAADTAAALANGLVVGWFQGRMEFGPRALGNRSILADPRRPGMKDYLNGKIKERESFRPFAPAVPAELAHEYFDLTGPRTSPYMLFTVPVLPARRSLLGAVTHVDSTARVQTVPESTAALFWRLLHEFGQRTGVPVLLNTSFNLRDEPIVCTPRDALRTLIVSGLDELAIGSFVVRNRGDRRPATSA